VEKVLQSGYLKFFENYVAFFLDLVFLDFIASNNVLMVKLFVD